MFGLATLAAVAAMAFIVVPWASATYTQLCNSHTGLVCGAEKQTQAVHQVLDAGTVGKLLAGIDVLCLGALMLAGIGSSVSWWEIKGVKFISGSANLSKPQTVQSTPWLSFTGCGTGSAHNNCTVTVETLPTGNLLKTGLDEGVLEAVDGQIRLQCPNAGLDCMYDLAGGLFWVFNNHSTAKEASITELGGKFFCSDEAFLDGLLETLGDVYVLG